MKRIAPPILTLLLVSGLAAPLPALAAPGSEVAAEPTEVSVAEVGPALPPADGEAEPSLRSASEPDPELVAHNQALSARAQRGDRRIITGRLVAAGGGGLFLIGGGLTVGGALSDRNGMVAAGVIGMLGGVAAASAGVALMIRGKRDLDGARRGELSLLPQPHGAALRLRF